MGISRRSRILPGMPRHILLGNVNICEEAEIDSRGNIYILGFMYSYA